MSKSPLSSSKNRWIIVVCWLIWTLVHFRMLHFDWEVAWQIALIDSSITNGLLAGAGLLIINNLRFYRPSKTRYVYLLIWCVAVCGLWGAAVKFGLAALFHDKMDYIRFLNKSMPVRFDIAFLVTGCVAMMSMLWYNLQEQQLQETRKTDAEKLEKEAELYKLRQQLQPHFLFNSLNSISSLAGTHPDQARKMIQQLSDFLRGALKKEEHQWITLEEELQHLQLYLDMEKVRFGHRLETEIIIQEESRLLEIPPMLLQPIVENAIKFGLYDTRDRIIIRIRTSIVENFLVVNVQNPFDPETSSPTQGTGFGLSSIQRRLYLLFERNDLLSTSVQDDLFTTIVKIPLHDKGHINR